MAPPRRATARARPLFDRRHRPARARRLVPQARPAHPVPQPGDVRGRTSAASCTTVLWLAGARRATARRRPASSSRSRSGSGSRCCSRTSPRRWPKGAARRRPTTLRERAQRRASRRSSRDRERDAASTASPATALRKGDLVLVEAGDVIPGDGEVVEGVASVDESAITGESAPVIRESGGDRCAVTGGTRVLSDWLVVRITRQSGRERSSTA